MEESIVSAVVVTAAAAAAVVAATVAVAEASATVASTDYTWRLALVGARFAYSVAAVDRVLRREICIERRTRERARAGQRAFSAHADGCIVHTPGNARNLFLSGARPCV